MKQSKEWRADVKVGFYGWGETRVGEDGIKIKDIVVGGEVQPKAVCKGGGDDKGCDSELSSSGSDGGGWIGVSKGRGEFNGHGWGGVYQRETSRGFLMRKTRGTK